MKRSTLIVLGLLTLTQAACAGAQRGFDEADRLAQKMVRRHPLLVDGAAVYVARFDGTVLHESYFGKYDESTKVPLASASKLVSAVAVMTLTLAGIAAFGRQGEIPADAARPAGGKPAPVRDRYTPGVMALLATSGLSRCATTAFPVLLLLCAEAGQQGIAVSFAAVLISLIGFLEIGAQLVAPVAVGRFDQLRINIVLLALISTGLIVAAISLAPVAAVCAAVLVAVGGGALRTTLTSWMVDLHQGQVGRLLGDNLGVNGIARAAAPATAAFPVQ